MAKKRVTLVHETGFEESVPADDKVEINQRLARGYRIKEDAPAPAAKASSTSGNKKDGK